MVSSAPQLALSRYALISEFAVNLSEATGLDALTTDVIPKLKYIMDFSRCTLALLSEDQSSYRVLTLLETRQPMPWTTKQNLPLDGGIHGDVILNGEPRIYGDLSRESVKGLPVADPCIEGGSLSSIMCLPLQVHAKTFGSIAFGTNQEVGYTRGDMYVATTIATHLSLAIDRWKMIEHVAERTAELEAFSYSVSHDLRAPLRAIDGFSHILLHDYGDKLDAEGQRLLNIICSSTRDMEQLIDDLLAFSRLGRQEMNPTDINMGELASAVFDELKSKVPERKLQLSIGALPPARADRAMMRQILVNLLSNAVKFTTPREAAVIEVGHKSEAGRGIYYVKDNGVGFDMQYVDKLFGVFQRLHTADEFEGTGVGLAIVQRIIHRHGGQVWAEGKVDEGAAIYFTVRQSEERR